MRNNFVWKVLAISIALVIIASGVVYGSTDIENGVGEGGKGAISLTSPPSIQMAGATSEGEWIERPFQYPTFGVGRVYAGCG